MQRLVVLCFVVALGGCGSARRGMPIEGPLALNDAEARGEVLFMRDCNQCHPNGESGLGPALNNKPLPRSAITLKVREGALGTMPAFHRDELSDRELGEIIDYVEALRKHH